MNSEEAAAQREALEAPGRKLMEEIKWHAMEAFNTKHPRTLNEWFSDLEQVAPGGFVVHACLSLINDGVVIMHPDRTLSRGNE